ncbi:CAP-Gly domain-containing linker protein 1-like isoform X2 [Plodia interpunctella]|uniref:CAP-Gly domain-containing linker protein 1-like isoform X2 n=1 Tax=Plodia interpunctella TaxID=58824 RepID=UPI002368708E|nr:CAP-Gly domain-containing linker protein 1-like isoform X2 [Plodia interpunctella]
MQDTADTKTGGKCRIPQRLPPNRTRTSLLRAKPQNVENTPPRPKSANRAKDDMIQGRLTHPNTPRTNRHERERPPLKRPSTIPRRIVNEGNPNKGRPVITVPIASGKGHGRTTSYKIATGLPDQETIKKCEDLEVCQSEFGYIDDLESITSPSDRAMQLKIKWEDRIIHFEKLKNELFVRQRDLLEAYASLRGIHQKLAEAGHKAVLPSAEDLRIMNVSNMSPNQLLQLCANSDGKSQEVRPLSPKPMSIDVNRLYNLPSKLVAHCEHTLTKRKEIIDWFESLKKQEKGISMSKLSKKLNEFSAENDILHCNLVVTKDEFYNELNDIIEVIRKGMNDTVAMQLRSEEMMYALSELSAKNDDLKKKIVANDHFRSQNNRYKVEELERELKEEHSKKMMLRERLNKAEGQVKINLEKASQLEATLEQARAQTRTLERTVQHLHEQNEKLQVDFDKELGKLTASIKENTEHLEEIADAREKLQIEKEHLEKRIEDLSAYYNESLENLKSEMNTNVVKLIETDERYQLEMNEKRKLEDKISSLCAQLLESELKYKDLQKILEDNEERSCKFNVSQKELESTKYDLNIAEREIADYKSRLSTQNEQIRELEQKCKESHELQESLKSELIFKEDCIKELEKKAKHFEQQLHDSKSKITTYEEELTALRNQLNRLHEDFGEFENISDLLEMVSQQKEKLMEATRQHEELIELLQSKDMDLERQTADLALKESQLEKKNDIIQMLSGKDDEQANIIKLLRNSLEMRSQADSEFQQKLVEKNTEIDKLITSLETRKQQIAEFEKIIMTLEEQGRKANIQISNLETIILTLEEQSRKDTSQKRKDQEKMAALESKIQEYESYFTHHQNKRQHDIPTPSDTLDNLIKLLENEIGVPLETDSTYIKDSDNKDYMNKKKIDGDRKHRDKNERVDGEPPLYSEPSPPKSVIRNFGIHCLGSNDENYAGDSLDRKKAITNMDLQKFAIPDTGMRTFGTLPGNKEFNPIKVTTSPKKNIAPRNLGMFSPDKLQEDKKYKMFKLAGHRL